MNKERPIIFSTPMVQAILSGRKTQTRRVVTKGLAHYEVGDILWVRETWADIPETEPGNIHYRASATSADLDWFKANGWKWNSPYHMFRRYARLFLRVTGVRDELLQDITPDKCYAEGILRVPIDGAPWAEDEWAITKYARLWDSLNAKRGYGWYINPLVRVIEFEVIDQ